VYRAGAALRPQHISYSHTANTAVIASMSSRACAHCMTFQATDMWSLQLQQLLLLLLLLL
jgi:hypothetical protein